MHSFCSVRRIVVPQHARFVLVVLQDGRQLEGELFVLTDRVRVAGRVGTTT
jgi:hypothetical protein